MIETIIWLITGRCNYNCKYCYAKKFKEIHELDTHECIRIIKEAAELGVKHIAFTGGEPFIRNDIFEIVERCVEQGIEVSITTNGSFIDNEKAKRIHELDIFLYISLDGVREKHNLIREKGSWVSLKETFDILNKFKIEFATITTLHKLNYIETKEIIKFCKELGAKFSCFLPLMWCHEPVFSTTQPNSSPPVLGRHEILYTLQLLNEGATEYKHKLSLWCMPFAKRFIHNMYIRIGGCRDMHTMDISVNGDVLICDVLDIVITNVKNKPLAQVFKEVRNSELMNEISHPELTGQCRECPIKHECLGGCYARTFAKFSNFNFTDPMCPGNYTKTAAPITVV